MPWDIGLGAGERFCPEGAVRDRDRLLGAVGESPTLEGSKNRVDVALRDMV